ncbi:MAG: DUF6580 family putative transport protein [Candidatus Liptonbacteria bacterium]
MSRVVFAAIFVLFSVGARLVDHAPNFVPIGALAIWAGMFLPRKIGVALPIAVMLASDAIIGFYDWRVMLTVYGSFVLMAAIGRVLRGHKGPAIVLGSLAGSLFFYITTNFAVWAFGATYAPTWQGLIQCYYLALPFFRNTLYSDLIYGIIFIGIYEFASQRLRRKKPIFLSAKQTLLSN